MMDTNFVILSCSNVTTVSSHISIGYNKTSFHASQEHNNIHQLRYISLYFLYIYLGLCHDLHACLYVYHLSNINTIPHSMLSHHVIINNTIKNYTIYIIFIVVNASTLLSILSYTTSVSNTL